MTPTPAPPPEERSVVITIRPRTVLLVGLVTGAVVVTLVVLAATKVVFSLLVFAVAIACLVRPAVIWLAKRTHTGIAVAAVFIGLIVFVGVVVAAETRAVTAGAQALQRAVPDRLERLQQGLAPGNPLRRFLIEDDVVGRTRRSIQGVPARFILGTESPSKGASRAGGVLLVTSLAAFMVTELPRTFEGLVRRLPVSSQPGAHAALRAAYRRGGCYVRRSLALGAACAVAGSVVAAVCGIPGAGLLGLWLGMWTLVPQVGIVVGALPLIGLAAGQGWVQFAVATVALTALAVAGERVRRRWIEQHTVFLGSAISLFVLMAGIELGQWPGALVALVGVAGLVAAVDAVGVPRVAAGPMPRPVVARQSTTALPVAPTRKLLVDIDTRTIFLSAALALALVIAARILGSVPQSVIRALVGILLAMGLNPLVGVTQRRLHLPRKAAVALVVGGFVGTVMLFTVFAVPRAVEQSRQLGKQVPTLVADLDRAPIVGRLVRGAHIDQRLASFLDDAPHVLTIHDKAIENVVHRAGESLLTAGWMLLMLLGALLDGPLIAARIKGAVPPSRRPAAEHFGNLIYLAVGRSAAGSGMSALLQGGVVLIIGLAFGVPLSVMLAANAALWAFVPQVGGFMAGAPLVIFALTQGLGTGVAVGLLFVVWMVFNNHVLHPVIVGRLVHISPLSSLVAVMVGGALGGFVGVMVAVPIAAVIHAALIPGAYRIAESSHSPVTGGSHD